MKKKVLIICRHFVPYTISLGWSIRMLKLAEYLIDRGYDVHVLSSRGNSEIDYFGYEDLLGRLNCNYIKDYLGVKECKITEDLKSGERGGPIKILRKILRNLIEELSVPDLGVYFIKKYYKKANELIAKHDIKNVIISGPRHSMQLIGLSLKNKHRDNINWIADYRDSWNNKKRFRKSIWFCQKMNESYEKKVLIGADHVTYVSIPIIKKIKSRYGFNLENKSKLIMNGYDAKLFGSIKDGKYGIASKNIVLMGYFGPIYPYRDPTNFMSSIAKIKDKADVPKFKIIIYGEVPDYMEKNFRIMLGDSVDFKKRIAHKDVCYEMKKMDYLLGFDAEKHDSDEIITGKLFEYMAAKKPIIVIGPKGMEAAKLVLDNDLGLEIDIYDKNDIKEKMYSVLTGKTVLGRGYESLDIEKFSRYYQYEKFLDILV